VPAPEGRVIPRRVNVSGRPRGKMGEAALGLVFTPNVLKSVAKVFLPRAIRAPLKYRIKDMFQKREPFDRDLRQRILEGYREDTSRLECLLGRDLSLWHEEGKHRDRGAGA